VPEVLEIHYTSNPKMKKAANDGGEVVEFKSGTRDSNPRLQPWQIGAQLKTKNNGAYGFHSESMNSTHSSLVLHWCPA
jgi:hypothetical protein